MAVLDFVLRMITTSSRSAQNKIPLIFVVRNENREEIPCIVSHSFRFLLFGLLIDSLGISSLQSLTLALRDTWLTLHIKHNLGWHRYNVISGRIEGNISWFPETVPPGISCWSEPQDMFLFWSFFSQVLEDWYGWEEESSVGSDYTFLSK